MRYIWLEWFRDQGRGQEASDAVGACETYLGTWPVAILMLKVDGDVINDDKTWRALLDGYGVNAMTHHSDRFSFPEERNRHYDG